jgi:DNA-binding CsgD family transcriptional regulator
MMDDADEQKRPSNLRVIALGERLVLVSLSDRDEPAGSFDDETLSAAERAVAELAARGLTNAEIARARQVTKRTVSNQLAVVYRKLGVSGRRELRAWFRGRGSSSIEKTA